METGGNDNGYNEGYFKSQFELLKHMYHGAAKNTDEKITIQFSVNDLATDTQKDGDEVLRSLYVLEGQKLVAPYPAGDFTSNNWCLTDVGADIAEKVANQADEIDFQALAAAS